MENNIDIYDYNNYNLNINKNILKDLTFFKVLIEVFEVDSRKIQKKDLKITVESFFKNLKIRIKSFQQYSNFIIYYSKFFIFSIYLICCSEITGLVPRKKVSVVTFLELGKFLITSSCGMIPS